MVGIVGMHKLSQWINNLLTVNVMPIIIRQHLKTTLGLVNSIFLSEKTIDAGSSLRIKRDEVAKKITEEILFWKLDQYGVARYSTIGS